MKPSLGRVVHYVWAGGVHHAGIITAIDPLRDTVQIAVFNSRVKATIFMDDCEFNEHGAENSWHWPEREA